MTRRALLKPFVLVLCTLPLAWLVARSFGLAGHGLGPNPIDELQDRLGDWSLRLLLLTLCIRPLAVLLRKPWIMGLRRMLGLFAFFYLCLHFANWALLDQRLDLAAIAADVVRRPYITVGFVAFLLLVPLAVTSTDRWRRRLGARWHRLHQLVYAAAILGCLHFWWEVKADWREPLLYAAALAVLLGWRVRQSRARTAAVAASARSPIPR